MSKLEQLRSLFPQFDSDVLEGVLSGAKDSVESAIDMLLSMDTTEKVEEERVREPIPLLRPSRRAGARKRQRQLARRNCLSSNTHKHSSEKKVKWVRFDPFVTIKQPLKDDNTFSILGTISSAGEDDGVPENWEEAEYGLITQVQEPVDEQPPLQEEEKLEEEEESSEDEVPELVSSDMLETHLCEAATPVEESSSSDSIEPADEIPELICVDEEVVEEAHEEEAAEEAHEEEAVEEAVEEEHEEEHPKPSCIIAVKVYFSEDNDIRRIALDKNDASAFDKLAESVSKLRAAYSSQAGYFAPKYLDDESEYVTMCSQEEFEECIRVHESSIWAASAEQRSMPILKLYL